MNVREKQSAMVTVFFFVLPYTFLGYTKGIKNKENQNILLSIKKLFRSVEDCEVLGKFTLRIMENSPYIYQYKNLF